MGGKFSGKGEEKECLSWESLRGEGVEKSF